MAASQAFPKRRSRTHTSMDSVRLFAGSCIFVIVMGYLVMLQSYRSFVSHQNTMADLDIGFDLHTDDKDNVNKDNVGQGAHWTPIQFERARRSIHGLSSKDVFQRYARYFLPNMGVSGNSDMVYSAIEGRMRKLMQDNHNSSSNSNKNNNYNNERSEQLNFRTPNWKKNNDHAGNGRGGRSQSRHNLPWTREMNVAIDGNIGFNEHSGDTLLTAKDRMYSCMDMNRMRNLQFVGSGWTKVVYEGHLDGKSVAVKTVDVNGHDVGQCMKEGFNSTFCYGRAAGKIIKEIVLLQALAHDNIIKVRITSLFVFVFGCFIY